ncbi:MAG: DUF3014 domain-containing protein [Gammaproteobacteria bacterium]|nr:DUF3014 domain-containing protein [Gammaproteobacteria bacterium]MDH4315925.1 DUF3014 domain-containing protein [Gammaproteobacteria bacterium]MDH5215250.1 DUF3014 domain-containing protein [Gammaproteobacteria bacterium]
MNKETSQWLFPAILAIVVAAGLWFYWSNRSEPVPVPVESLQPGTDEQAQEPQTGPRYPIPDVAEPVDKKSLRPLPPLDDSDEYFRLEMSNLYGDTVANLLVRTQLIERIVATIDNLPRAHVSEKIRPVGRLDGTFPVDGQDGSGEYTLNPDNYARYDLLVQLVSSADINKVADVYRRFYPLFQKAYVNLGYPDGYFNDRLIEVIDHLLETPVVNGPVVLVRPNVLYQFADSQLESRSSGQKLLIRMGPQHAAKVKETLRALRAAIATQ